MNVNYEIKVKKSKVSIWKKIVRTGYKFRLQECDWCCNKYPSSLLACPFCKTPNEDKKKDRTQ